MNKMLVMVLMGLLNFAQAQTISVTNNSKNDRVAVLAEIPWKDILSKNKNVDVKNFKVIEVATKLEVAYQLETKGNAKPENLLIQISISGKTTQEYKIIEGKPVTVSTKTYARFVPERLDDFAWENDKIAFRTYGKALEGTKGDAYGFDVWAKRTTELILDKRYKIGDYHKDNGDGLDYYHVGHTLGAGNIAPIVGDSIYYGGNYHRWKILDNGPLRTTFKLEYDEWLVNGKKVNATKTISLDAGSHLNKVEADYRFEGDSLNLVIGIIKRPEQGIMNLDEQSGVMIYWEPEHGQDGITGVAVIVPSKVYGNSVNKDQMLAHVRTKKNKPFVYYTGACWNKAGEFTKASDWNKYINNFKNELNSSLKIKLK